MSSGLRCRGAGLGGPRQDALRLLKPPELAASFGPTRRNSLACRPSMGWRILQAVAERVSDSGPFQPYSPLFRGRLNPGVA